MIDLMNAHDDEQYRGKLYLKYKGDAMNLMFPKGEKVA